MTPRVREAIVVEGRCDKAKLSSILEDPVIVETGGFQIFKDQERMELIRQLAAQRGVIIFTDSDGAGFLIRSRLSQCLPPSQVKHAYIPDIYGKERRKAKPSKEGKLGVEGMPLRQGEQRHAGRKADKGGHGGAGPLWRGRQRRPPQGAAKKAGPAGEALIQRPFAGAECPVWPPAGNRPADTNVTRR